MLLLELKIYQNQQEPLNGAKLPGNIQIGTMGAKLDDFDFDLPVDTMVVVKIPGQASIKLMELNLIKQPEMQ